MRHEKSSFYTPEVQEHVNRWQMDRTITWYNCTVGDVGNKVAPLGNCPGDEGSRRCGKHELEEPMSHLMPLDSNAGPVRVSHERVAFSMCQGVSYQPVAQGTDDWKIKNSIL